MLFDLVCIVWGLTASQGVVAVWKGATARVRAVVLNSRSGRGQSRPDWYKMEVKLKEGRGLPASDSQVVKKRVGVSLRIEGTWDMT
jgi:hypothetical protein